ncbi:hypothetical protein VQL36_07240 [Chengkuizengella sp. SCS-71B]
MKKIKIGAVLLATVLTFGVLLAWIADVSSNSLISETGLKDNEK